MRRVLLLGATGSIGTTFLNNLDKFPDYIQLAGIVSYQSAETERIAEKYHVPYLLMKGRKIQDFTSFVSSLDFDITLNAVSGSEGLIYSDILLEFGKDIALANKETIVLGGDYFLEKAKKNGIRIIPVDSEHSAINTLINAHGKENVDRIIITCSGGPFFRCGLNEKITLKDALSHPTWNMGAGITVDSATLANKGLEVIEASYLFSFPPDKISVVIHPESKIHSIVELRNGGMYLEESMPDMAFPIFKALLGDDVKEKIARTPNFPHSLTFLPWDKEKWKMLSLSYLSLEKGGFYPGAYMAANEYARNLFIGGEIPITRIPEFADIVLSHDFSRRAESTEEIFHNIENVKKIIKKEI